MSASFKIQEYWVATYKIQTTPWNQNYFYKWKIEFAKSQSGREVSNLRNIIQTFLYTDKDPTLN